MVTTRKATLDPWQVMRKHIQAEQRLIDRACKALDREELDAAISLFSKAASKADEFGDDGEEGWAWMGVGIARLQQDRAVLAADCFAKAVDLGWRGSAHDLVEAAMRSLHALAIQCHDLARADERYWDMLHYLVHVRSIAPMEGLIAAHAGFLAEHGRWADARAMLRDTASCLYETAYDVVHGTIQASLGMVYQSMGKPDAAIPCFARAYTIFTKAGSRGRAGDAALDVAISHLLIGDAGQERAWLHRSLDEYAGCSGATERASTARKMLDAL
jgi:tetratricopeptide (TPR) repeat protein